MRRIFVTGATGFIGAAVVHKLVADGYEVAALVRPESDCWRLGRVSARIRLIHGSLANHSTYEPALNSFSPDTVLHLGWYGSGKERRNDPEQVRTNVAGSVDLFLAAQRAGCRVFVGAGSQAEYARSTGVLTEDSPTGPTTLYGAAKLATQCLLSQLADTHGVRFAWLRLFSVYGPRDGETTLVSYVINELLRGRRPVVSRGEHLWDYLFVDDAAAAITMVGALPATGVFNLASGSAQPLRDTILMIRDQINPALDIGFGEAGDSSAATPLRCSVSKLQQLGWTATTPLDVGLRLTIDWMTTQLPTK